MTTRAIPARVAGVLEELELRRPKLVTVALLADVIATRAAGVAVRYVADTLQRRGWLLPLRTAGAWEFAPAARAGAYGAGDPYIELRATLLRRPGLPIAVAEESAAWLHGLLERRPDREVIAAPRGVAPPKALSEFRCVRIDSHLPAAEVDGLPVWRLETLLVAMAARPSAFRPWATVSEWLPDAFLGAAAADIEIEIQGRSGATLARLGHLARAAGATEVERLLAMRSASLDPGPFYLGPRSRSAVWDPVWRVRDSVLGGKKLGP
ncbi:MAG: hypothetical protein C0418_02260 [Coriobacteriaceae bacterium]|nr:hypothetical protein [Coriobacteriaceae bacterium]